jgi:hypothetical protein
MKKSNRNKRKLINVLIVLSTLITGSSILSSCYYDNEEYLYPTSGTPVCDTLNPTYTANIAPIFADNCNGCHNSASASAGIITENHAGVTANIDMIWIAINRQPSEALFMPQGGYKLSTCDLAKIRQWRNLGMPDN